VVPVLAILRHYPSPGPIYSTPRVPSGKWLRSTAASGSPRVQRCQPAEPSLRCQKPSLPGYLGFDSTGRLLLTLFAISAAPQNPFAHPEKKPSTRLLFPGSHTRWNPLGTGLSGTVLAYPFGIYCRRIKSKATLLVDETLHLSSTGSRLRFGPSFAHCAKATTSTSPIRSLLFLSIARVTSTEDTRNLHPMRTSCSYMFSTMGCHQMLQH